MLASFLGSTFGSHHPPAKVSKRKDSDDSSASDGQEEDEEEETFPLLRALRDKEKISLCNGLADSALRLKLLTLFQASLSQL